ncbi:PWWP domain-containing DNA repair factor 4-like [Cavia porcellus]|uniref:PWWP domain-containing DNA repair factor 4-like n=1 Tax=Cavia porcellus TaxID=10141 RepID=UPI002FDFC32E
MVPQEGADWKAPGPLVKETGERRVLRKSLETLEEIPPWGERGHRHAQEVPTSKEPQKVPGEQASPHSPQKQARHKGGSQARRRRRGHSGSMPVPWGKEAPLSRETGQRHKAMAPAPPGRRASSTSSSITSVSPQAPATFGIGAQYQGLGKLDMMAIVSQCHLDIKRGQCTLGVQCVPSRPAGVVPPTARGLSTEVQNTSPGPQAAASSPGHTFPCSMQDPGLGASPKLGWEGVTASSTSPDPALQGSLRVLQRKRKLQAAGQEEGPPAPGSTRPSQAVTQPQPQLQHQHQRASPTPQGQATSLGSTCAPATIARGSVVWYKCAEHPFWPAVVTSVSLSRQMARVLLIEANLCGERSGIRVPLGRLKPLDCEEKAKLVRRASRAFGPSLAWCLSLVAHYREGLARGSFRGSFLEYYAADASYPLRRALRGGPGLLPLCFPEVHYSDLEDSEEEEQEKEDSPHPNQALGLKVPRKRLLPDRTRAVRDRTNQKIVDFIVKTKGTDCHLLDIVQGRKPSRWLEAFLQERRYLVCMETYLEDDDQLLLVARHLQRLFERTEEPMLALRAVDKVRLVMEVLLPEAVICSIATLEGLDYHGAQEKFLRGPLVHPREKELFDRKIRRERKKRSRASEELLCTPPKSAPTP